MIDKVTIGNMALAHIGTSTTIESFDEASIPAKQIKLWYDYSRKQALEMSDWTFARKTQLLAVHADDPPVDWAFRYQYPSDCLHARYLVNPLGKEADAVPFEVRAQDSGEAKCILTNLEDAELVYTFDQELTSMFSPFFVALLSRVLAHNVAYSLTGKQSVQEKQAEMIFDLRRHAPAHDANEQVSAPPREAEWIRGR